MYPGCHKKTHVRSAVRAGQAVSTRAACTDLRAAYLYATSPHMFQGDTEKAFNAVRDRVQTSSLHGCVSDTVGTTHCRF